MKKNDIREETKLLLELAEMWHERGLSFPTRTIYLGSEEVTGDDQSGVDARLAERVLKNIHTLERISEAPITLLINNPGGDVYAGLAIIDAVKLSPCDVVGLVRGSAMSMGSWILQACDKRIMGPNATQMIHYGYAGFSGHAKTAEKQAEENKRIDDIMEGVYLSRIQEKHKRYTLGHLRELLAHDTYLTAQESVDLGLADEVG